MMKKITMVMGVIGADVHAVGNRILEYAFTGAGINVVNLGVMVTQEEYIAAAIETNADIIVVSSLYGHGEIDCRGLRGKCDEAGLNKILLYVGGNLVVGKSDFAEVKKIFLDMGYSRVYPPGSTPEQCIEDIKTDLNITSLKETSSSREECSSKAEI
ncbi:MAG: methylaspartate mutase subunit S [Treponema sp.]|nr:methylaspartate mutase subunit S [Treponema sp.]